MTTTLKDPVCHMDVAPERAADKSAYEGTTYYFCCSACKKSFDKEPKKHLGQTAAGHAHACC